MIKVNKPKIRFKNFNDSWSLRKLSDTQTDFKDGNYGEAYPKETDLTSSTQGVPFLRGSDLDNGKLTLTNARYITQSKHNELISGHLIEDDIVIAVRGSLGSLGYVGPDNEGWNINSQLAIIRTRKIELIGNYLIQFLLSNRGNKEISSHITGTALKQLPIKQLKNIKVPIPKIEEQSAIGSLFRTLDDLMSSYKDNLANYQSLKASMLSKMFPKAGQTVPEIRLDGFKGEWRIIKLGDVLSELKSGLSRELSNDDIGLPVIRANNISDGNLNLDRDIKYWFKDDPKGANTANYFVRENDILVNFINSETKMGTAAIVLREPDRETIYTTNILKLTVKEDYYPYFVYLMTFVQSYQNYIKAITKPSVNQASFTTVDFKKYEFLCPAFQEQQAISAYFLNFDNLINSHQEKITQIETLKKKLLQDMFI